jgi:hypothetical protein
MIKIYSQGLYINFFKPKNQMSIACPPHQMTTTVLKKQCVCIGSNIRFLPQPPLLNHYSPNRHAIIRYRPDSSKTGGDSIVRAFVHSSIEKAFWELESPHFTFDAKFEVDATGLPQKVKISITRSGVSSDVDVYFLHSIAPGSCKPVRKIVTISDATEAASKTFHLFWQYHPKASPSDIKAWSAFYHSPSAKVCITKDLCTYFGVDARSATTFRISRKNAARIHNNNQEIEKHLAVALTAIKFKEAHLSLVFDFGYSIKSVSYLTNVKANDVISVLNERILNIKSARADFTSGEISDIIQCVRRKEGMDYGRTIGAFLVYSKMIELSNRSVPCTRATKWLLSNGSTHYEDGGPEEKVNVATVLHGQVDYVDSGDLFCTSDYVKACQMIKQSRTLLLEKGIAKKITHIKMSPWDIDDYTRHIHLNFETSIVFMLTKDLFNVVSKHCPAFSAMIMVTAGETLASSLKSMSGIVKDVYIFGIDQEPVSVLGLKFQWIAQSLEASKIRGMNMHIQTALPYWRTDVPIRWCMVPPSDNRTTGAAEAIYHLECKAVDIKLITFEQIDQILSTTFTSATFVVPDRKTVEEYYEGLSEPIRSPPPLLKNSGRKFLRGSDAASMMSVDWEMGGSRQTSDLSSSTSSAPSAQFNMKTFIERRREKFEVASKLTYRSSHDRDIYLLCFGDNEKYKFYLEEIERIMTFNTSSITLVVQNIPSTEKLKTCIKAETYYVSAACKNFVKYIGE